MGIKRHRPEEIVTKLRQVEVLVGQGMARVVDGESIVARDIVTLVLTFDHRVIDGAPCARFLAHPLDRIEHPQPLLG